MKEMFSCSRRGEAVSCPKHSNHPLWTTSIPQAPTPRFRQDPWENPGSAWKDQCPNASGSQWRLFLPLPGAIQVTIKLKFHKPSRSHKVGVFDRWSSKWIIFPPQIPERFWSLTSTCTSIMIKWQKKIPSFIKLNDKLFPFFWWRAYTGNKFHKKKKVIKNLI